MTTAQLLATARDALKADTGLNAWCVENFGRAPTIYVGIDESQPPALEDYPVVALVGVDQLRGDTKVHLQWMVILGVGVVNEEVAVAGNTKTQTGLLQAETLRELCEDALYRSRIAETESAGDASSESYHPLFVSYTSVTFKVLRSTRRGLP